jgi:hypothetical protein
MKTTAMTIAEQLGITGEAPVTININNAEGNSVYRENLDGFWVKHKYDETGKRITHCEMSSGYSYEIEYNEKGNELLFKDSVGTWTKSEYDSDGSICYEENQNGVVFDLRAK